MAFTGSIKRTVLAGFDSHYRNHNSLRLRQTLGGNSRIVGHRLKDSIIELDGSWNQQGGVRGLGRHSGSRGCGLSQGSGR
jgi:hypothetical protein